MVKLCAHFSVEDFHWNHEEDKGENQTLETVFEFTHAISDRVIAETETEFRKLWFKVFDNRTSVFEKLFPRERERERRFLF